MAHAGVSVQSSPLAGLGVFASRAFAKDELIGYYIGEVLDARAFDARYPATEGGDLPSYCYALRGRPNLLVIDARDPLLSSWARYINSPHGTKLRANVRWGKHIYGPSDTDARVEVRAAVSIAKDSELLISYGRGYAWGEKQTTFVEGGGGGGASAGTPPTTRENTGD